jgi:hypothetical protein
MVEAFLNDLFWQTRDPISARGVEFGRLMTVVSALDLVNDPERFNLESKIQLTSIALRETAADFASQPLQSLRLLTKVRNFVMHMRPVPIRFKKNDRAELEPHGVAVALCTAVGMKVRELDHPVTIPGVIRYPEVGSWAYRTAFETVTEIHSWVPKEAHGISGGIATLLPMYPPGEPRRPFPQGLVPRPSPPRAQ